MAEDGLIRDITVNNLDVQGSLKLNSNIIKQEQINNVISGMFFASTSENGSGNTGYGYQTPGTTGTSTSTTQSTSIGYQACKTGGTDNTAVGYKALESSSSAGNTVIGFQAGDNITTGNYNVCIGHGVDAPTANSEKTLTIGSNGTNWILGDSTGLVTIPNNLTVTSNFNAANNNFRITSATGNTVIAGTLDVAGATGIDGDFDVATDKFTIASTTGNTVIAGTLDVAGATGIDGDFDVATDKFTIASTTGNTAIAGTLDVAGDVNIEGKLKGDVVIGEDSTDLMVVNSNSEFLSDMVIYEDVVYIQPEDSVNGDGDKITQMLLKYSKVILTKGTYTIKAGYPIRITTDNKILEGTNGSIIKLGDNAYEPCIYIGTKGEDSISNILVTNIKIDGNRGGNLARGAVCKLKYTDEVSETNRLHGGRRLNLINKSGTEIFFEQGSGSAANTFYFNGFNMTADNAMTALTNVIDNTSHFSASIDTSKKTITITQTKNNDNSEDAHTSTNNNEKGNLGINAICTLVYTDGVSANNRLYGERKLSLKNKSGTEIFFEQGSGSAANTFYFNGFNMTADNAMTALTNVIDNTSHFSASIDTSKKTITITYIPYDLDATDRINNENGNFDLSDDPPIFELSNFALLPQDDTRGYELSNFITREVRETSGSLTNPQAKNNGIVVHKVNDLTITNCIIENTLSGGIVCGDKCMRVNISDCKSRGHVFDGMAFDGPHEEFSINNCTLYENDFAGFSLDTGIIGGFNITNCHCINNHSEGFYIRNVNDITISNCIVKYNNKHGFGIQKVDDNKYPKNIHISNCLIEESGKIASDNSGSQKSKYDGIQISKGYNVMLTGCNIINNSKRGVSIESNSENINISNCNFISNGEEAHDAENNSGDAIFLSNSNNINISNSLFKDNFSSAIQVENFASPVDGIAITKDININCCSFYNHVTDKCIRINGFSNGGIENVTVNSCIFRNNHDDIHCQVWLQQSGDFEKNKSYTIKDIGTDTNWANIDSNNLTAYVKGTVIKTPDFDTDAEIVTWKNSQAGDGWAAGANNIIISNNIFIKEDGHNDVIGTYKNSYAEGAPQVLFDINNTIIPNS